MQYHNNTTNYTIDQEDRKILLFDDFKSVDFETGEIIGQPNKDKSLIDKLKGLLGLSCSEHKRKLFIVKDKMYWFSTLDNKTK